MKTNTSFCSFEQAKLYIYIYIYDQCSQGITLSFENESKTWEIYNCAVTGVIAAALLLRGHRRRRICRGACSPSSGEKPLAAYQMPQQRPPLEGIVGVVRSAAIP